PPQVVEGIVPYAKLTFFSKKNQSIWVNPLSHGASTLTAPTFQGEPICCGDTMNENRKKHPS
ncbi:MAG: hypothetical protein IJW34_03400, partial [Clostridia bacterium]|nr:hypothetical protein [Clostridia bacterium]